MTHVNLSFDRDGQDRTNKADDYTVKDAECIAFLQWALPRLDLRWPGYRKVRRQVCKRISRRMRDLELGTIDDYRSLLEREADEWQVLDAACRITISRFYRDKHVFDVLADSILPETAARARREGRPAQCWCAGCASGEEVYTLAILWDRVIAPAYAGVELEIIGTDADPVMIERANRACFSPGSFKDMPPEWLKLSFELSDGAYCVEAHHRRNVTILSQDIRQDMPEGPFDLILCRNLVFTYFERPLQLAVLQRMMTRLRSGGYLVTGAHEKLPDQAAGFEEVPGCGEIYRYETYGNI